MAEVELAEDSLAMDSEDEEPTESCAANPSPKIRFQSEVECNATTHGSEHSGPFQSTHSATYGMFNGDSCLEDMEDETHYALDEG